MVKEMIGALHEKDNQEDAIAHLLVNGRNQWWICSADEDQCSPKLGARRGLAQYLETYATQCEAIAQVDRMLSGKQGHGPNTLNLRCVYVQHIQMSADAYAQQKLMLNTQLNTRSRESTL